MNVVRVGQTRDVFSLRHLITMIHQGSPRDPGGLPPGGSRLTFERGPHYDLNGDETEEFDRALDARMEVEAAAQSGVGVVAVSVDPTAGLNERRGDQGSQGS